MPLVAHYFHFIMFTNSYKKQISTEIKTKNSLIKNCLLLLDIPFKKIQNMKPGKKKKCYFELEDIFHIQYILTVLRYKKQKKKGGSLYLSIHPSHYFLGGKLWKTFQWKSSNFESLGSEHTLRPSLKGANIFIFNLSIFFFFKDSEPHPALPYLSSSGLYTSSRAGCQNNLTCNLTVVRWFWRCSHSNWYILTLLSFIFFFKSTRKERVFKSHPQQIRAKIFLLKILEAYFTRGHRYYNDFILSQHYHLKS